MRQGPRAISRSSPTVATLTSLVIVVAATLTLASTPRDEDRMTQAATSKTAAAPQFTDITAAAGIKFRHNSGAFGKKYLPETLGAGAAFLDYDSDGWQDIFLVNSRSWPEKKAGQT